MKKTIANIVILDDSPEILIAARMLLKRHFEQVTSIDSPKKITHFLNENKVDVILLDMNYRIGVEDGSEGIFWLKQIQELSPNTQIILMSSFGNLTTAIQGIKLGAMDYILKPWNNQELVDLVKQGVQKSRKQSINKQTSLPLKDREDFYGEDPNIAKVYEMAKKVAKTDATTLILGENGTGKYVLAKYLFQNSNRNDKPFIHVDLGSLNENLFESELFGYAKGAFTDAKIDTAGRFENSNGGTIFLDEIANIPLHLQAKLLQVIQNKCITRLGETQSRKIDVRIICATNADLEQMVKDKTFREDLYYRINTISLLLPALRQRPKDIEGLLSYFIQKYAEQYAQEIPTITPETLQGLIQYNWPGNIRELQNKVERAIILCEDNKLCLQDFDISTQVAVDLTMDMEQTNLEQIEKQTIIKAMHQYGGNITRCSRELGLSRSALYRRLEKYQINF
ncbi:sigma-54-dependent transcriptional regulator [Myroides sp. LJL116]